MRKQGGLQVLVLAIQESERVDRQLKGRAGRQGDPGETYCLVRVDDPQAKAAGMDGGLQFVQPFFEGNSFVCITRSLSHWNTVACVGLAQSHGQGRSRAATLAQAVAHHLARLHQWKAFSCCSVCLPLSSTGSLLQSTGRRCRTWQTGCRGCS